MGDIFEELKRIVGEADERRTLRILTKQIPSQWVSNANYFDVLDKHGKNHGFYELDFGIEKEAEKLVA